MPFKDVKVNALISTLKYTEIIKFLTNYKEAYSIGF